MPVRGRQCSVIYFKRMDYGGSGVSKSMKTATLLPGCRSGVEEFRGIVSRNWSHARRVNAGFGETDSRRGSAASTHGFKELWAVRTLAVWLGRPYMMVKCSREWMVLAGLIWGRRDRGARWSNTFSDGHQEISLTFRYYGQIYLVSADALRHQCGNLESRPRLRGLASAGVAAPSNYRLYGRTRRHLQHGARH